MVGQCDIAAYFKNYTCFEKNYFASVIVTVKSCCDKAAHGIKCLVCY